jgi:hypothetical protein
MIKLQINQSDIDKLNTQINMKVQAIGELTKDRVLQEVSRAAFIILSERFMKSVDRHSIMNPKKMHHVYEWVQVGRPTARLFILERSNMINGSVITSRFLTSKTVVPIPASLRSPGNTGKSVKSKHVFRNKADIMESGKPVTIHAKKILAFMGENGMHFVQPGTVINILNPGGKQVKNSFSQYMVQWYGMNAQTIMDSSGLYERIVNETSIVLSKNNTGMADVRVAVSRIINSITHGVDVVR